MDLFDEAVCEARGEGVRYVLTSASSAEPRRNPQRVERLSRMRRDKRQTVQRLVELAAQAPAQREEKRLSGRTQTGARGGRRPRSPRQNRRAEDRRLGCTWKPKTSACGLRVDEQALAAEAGLDGCYVIKTGLPAEVADKQLVHDRYKDLAEVERAFRTRRTAHLEIRPVYVRTEDSTRGHVLVVMLAYLVVRALRRAWAHLNVTVEEGLERLTTLCSQEVTLHRRGATVHRIP